MCESNRIMKFCLYTTLCTFLNTMEAPQVIMWNFKTLGNVIFKHCSKPHCCSKSLSSGFYIHQIPSIWFQLNNSLYVDNNDNRKRRRKRLINILLYIINIFGLPLQSNTNQKFKIKLIHCEISDNLFCLSPSF